MFNGSSRAQHSSVQLIKTQVKRIVSNSDMFISYCNATQMIRIKNALCYSRIKIAWEMEFDEKEIQTLCDFERFSSMYHSIEFDRGKEHTFFQSFDSAVAMLLVIRVYIFIRSFLRQRIWYSNKSFKHSFNVLEVCRFQLWWWLRRFHYVHIYARFSFLFLLFPIYIILLFWCF